jgi:uridine kinase
MFGLTSLAASNTAILSAMKRQEMLETLAAVISAQKKPHPLRVGINGVDASGKTYLADELANVIRGKGIIRASIDGFHHPREIRYRKGRNSPEGYYKDSFDNQAFIEKLLEPLGPSGNLIYQTVAFDHKTNSHIEVPHKQAMPDDILILDGIFLFRPELQSFWDLKIFIDVPFLISVQRAVERDGKEREQEEMKMQHERYMPGQELYFAEANPKQQAHVIIGNADFLNPSIVVQNLP